jgi:hypothetical protein
MHSQNTPNKYKAVYEFIIAVFFFLHDGGQISCTAHEIQLLRTAEVAVCLSSLGTKQTASQTACMFGLLSSLLKPPGITVFLPLTNDG